MACSIRARRPEETRVAAQRGLARGEELHVVGQQYRQFSFRQGDYPVVRAVDDRYRATPVPLARQQPVAQAVLHLAFPEPMFLKPGDRLGLRLACVFDAVQPLAVYPRAVAGVGPALPAFGNLHRADLRQPVRRCEIPVPVVLRGHSHDCAGPVPHQDIVRQVARDLFAVEGVDRVAPSKNAALFQ